MPADDFTDLLTQICNITKLLTNNYKGIFGAELFDLNVLTAFIEVLFAVNSERHSRTSLSFIQPTFYVEHSA